MNMAECSDLPAFVVTDQTSETAIIQQNESFLPPLLHNAAAPARPGHFAEREELDAALQTRKPDALRLFIERHPDSRYRKEAQDALRRLSSPLLPR